MELQSERIKLYEEFIDIFMNTLKLSTTHSVKEKAIKTLGARLQHVGLRMAIISSDIVLKNFLKWRAVAQGGDGKSTVDAFGDLILEMRKEMIPTTSRTKEDIFDILT